MQYVSLDARRQKLLPQYKPPFVLINNYYCWNIWGDVLLVEHEGEIKDAIEDWHCQIGQTQVHLLQFVKVNQINKSRQVIMDKGQYQKVVRYGFHPLMGWKFVKRKENSILEQSSNCLRPRQSAREKWKNPHQSDWRWVMCNTFNMFNLINVSVGYENLSRLQARLLMEIQRILLSRR